MIGINNKLEDWGKQLWTLQIVGHGDPLFGEAGSGRASPFADPKATEDYQG